MHKPLYDSYCFSHIPQLVRHLLTDDPAMGLPSDVLGELERRYDTVVLFLIDGFGYRLFERYAEQMPFLHRFVKDGVVSKLTSQFPSTTAVHMTTLHTGLPLAQSGVPEWLYFEPLLDRVFAPMLYSSVGKHTNEAVDPALSAKLFPTKTLYSDLGQQGVNSYCFLHSSYAASPFSNRVLLGATKMPFRTLPEAMVNLTECISATQGQPTYICVYIDVVDAISHTYGPDSNQVDAELRTLFSMIESLVTPTLASDSKTCVLLTADHGLTTTHDEVLYLDHMLPQIAALTKTTRDGVLIAPTGGKRDLFLHIEERYLEEAFQTCTEALAGQASVVRTQTMIDEGYFGPMVSERLQQRLGNLLVLPAPHRRIWWSQGGRFDLATKKGDHGGLSADEMEIPLLVMAPNGV